MDVFRPHITTLGSSQFVSTQTITFISGRVSLVTADNALCHHKRFNKLQLHARRVCPMFLCVFDGVPPTPPPPPPAPAPPPPQKIIINIRLPQFPKQSCTKTKQKQQTNAKKRLSRGTFCKVRLIRRRRRRRISKKTTTDNSKKKKGKKRKKKRKKKKRRKKENISSTFRLKRIRLCLTKHKNTGLLAQGPAKQSNRLLFTTLARASS